MPGFHRTTGYASPLPSLICAQFQDLGWGKQITGKEYCKEVRQLTMTSPTQLLPANDGRHEHRVIRSMLIQTAASMTGMNKSQPISRPTEPSNRARNEPCPCGSGRKYKHCCGSNLPTARADPAPPGLRMPPAAASIGPVTDAGRFLASVLPAPAGGQAWPDQRCGPADRRSAGSGEASRPVSPGLAQSGRTS